MEAPFPKPERLPVRVDNSIHPWKRAWILPLDHPFAAITDPAGRFEISGLPPGEHLFHVWHERTGWLEKKLAVRITAGQTAELTLQYPAKRFEPKKAAANSPKLSDEILKLRDERRLANDRDAARKLLGTWRLTLPRGFEYEVSLTAAEDGCVVLGGRKHGNLFGTFAVHDGRLLLVHSGEAGILDFIWKINDEQSLTLITSDTRVGASYVGAKLQRIKPALATERRTE